MKAYFLKILLAICSGAIFAIVVYHKEAIRTFEEAKQQEKLKKEKLYLTQAAEIHLRINENLGKNKYLDANLLNEELQKIPTNAYLKADALLQLAKHAIEHHEAIEAERQLKAVLSLDDNDEYKVIARLRLAGIYLDTRRYEEGLNILDYPDRNLDPKLSSLIHDRRADILFAKNDFASASQEYTNALSKLDVDDKSRELIILKIDALKKTSDVRTIAN